MFICHSRQQVVMSSVW